MISEKLREIAAKNRDMCLKQINEAYKFTDASRESIEMFTASEIVKMEVQKSIYVMCVKGFSHVKEILLSYIKSELHFYWYVTENLVLKDKTGEIKNYSHKQLEGIKLSESLKMYHLICRMEQQEGKENNNLKLNL